MVNIAQNCFHDGFGFIRIDQSVVYEWKFYQTYEKCIFNFTRWLFELFTTGLLQLIATNCLHHRYCFMNWNCKSIEIMMQVWMRLSVKLSCLALCGPSPWLLQSIHIIWKSYIIHFSQPLLSLRCKNLWQLWLYSDWRVTMCNRPTIFVTRSKLHIIII